MHKTKQARRNTLHKMKYKIIELKQINQIQWSLKTLVDESASSPLFQAVHASRQKYDL